MGARAETRAAPRVLDHAYVPMPRSDVRLVAVGDEAVLVDRWNLALVLNPTGAMIWRRFDGCRPIRDVAGELAEETGAACEEVTLDVVRFVERMGVDGFLAGYVSPPLDDDDELELQFVPVMPVGEGSIVIFQGFRYRWLRHGCAVGPSEHHC